MPRKSPRARRKPDVSQRLPGKSRPRATPGRGRKRASPARTAKPGRAPHARKGGHPPSAAPTKPRGRRPVARRGLRPRRAFAAPEPARVQALIESLARLYPDATTALHHRNPVQLLVATILSAQCTDARVNLVTPALFARYPDAAAFASAPIPELEAMIRSTGFFHSKAVAIQSCCADLVAKHGGRVPRTMEELTALHGVGRKTANVVLGNAYGIPGVVVDTHVSRLSQRLGLTSHKDPVKIEHALMIVVPRERWTLFSHWLILHGRETCNARKPRCSACVLAPFCPRTGVTVSQ
jgi:endonuclease-3